MYKEALRLDMLGIYHVCLAELIIICDTRESRCEYPVIDGYSATNETDCPILTDQDVRAGSSQVHLFAGLGHRPPISQG